MSHPKHILTVIYYLSLLCSILAAMIGYHLTYHKGIYFDPKSQISINYYSFVIWYLIITFPILLKLSRSIKHLKHIPDDGSREHYYKIYAILCLTIITIGLIASIIGIYIFQIKHLFWVAGICIIGIILCKPTEKRINSDLTPLTPTETEKNEE